MKIAHFDFRLAREESLYRVNLSVDRSDQHVGTFEFDLKSSSRISQVIRDIEANNCRKDDLRDVGSHLWIGLVENEIGDFFKQRLAAAENTGAHLIFRLNLPPELEKLPWETLYDEAKEGFLCSNPNISVVRTPPTSLQVHSDGEPVREKLRILTVVPEGSGLQAEHEWNTINAFAEKMGPCVEADRLQGRVNPVRIADELSRRPWNILHFIGHGEVDENDRVSIRLNKDDRRGEELWVEAETFAEMFRGSSVRLVVLNCCLGATPNPKRTLSGLGPLLLRAGVSCVVAMRYEIPDDVAIKFSNEFYHQLLSGRNPGRVDLAVQLARRSLHLNSTESKIRGFVTPVLYIAQDHEHLFELRSRHTVPVAQPILAPPLPENVPAEIVDVFQEGLCIPVIGPGILAAGATRKGMPGLDPGQLAGRLAQESNYPRNEDFDAVKITGEWLHSMLFQCVCQHYQYVHRRFKLVRSIQKAYERTAIPQSLRNIASWNVPGIIYTYFDGLMEEALRQQDKSMRTLVNLTEEIDTNADIPLLVLLRGSIAYINSLILTEDDHDRLWHDLGHMSSPIISLTREAPGRSLLLIGVSPRDPIIRRLCTQLLDSGPTRNQGPTFFVCRDHTDADQAYWEKFDVYWIKEELNDFIWALSNISPGGPS